MPLVKCPDCGNQISDSAPSCIHCGRPMRESKESIMAEIQVKLEELRKARQDLDDDRQYYDENPSQAEPGWWQGDYDYIHRLETEISDLKRRL
jgi:hypothetical protein